MPISEVPSYYLYGEEKPAGNVQLVHCQALFSRISEQNWEIRPHRHNQLWQLFLLDEGEIDAVLEFERLTLIGPCVVVVPVGKVHGFSYGAHARGTMISVADGFLRGVLADGGLGALPHRSDGIQIIKLTGNNQAHAWLLDLFGAIETEASQRRAGFRQALGALMQLLFVQLDRIDPPKGELKSMDDQGRCFESFRELVASNMTNHLPVADYCQQLGIGERRLNRICRAVVGDSPLGYIHRQLVEEAKRYLVHTAMPITNIGYELGFEDSAYFSRFFKKRVGKSPSAFASQHRI